MKSCEVTRVVGGGKLALVWFIGLWYFACPVYSSTSSPWMFIYYTIRYNHRPLARFYALLMGRT